MEGWFYGARQAIFEGVFCKLPLEMQTLEEGQTELQSVALFKRALNSLRQHCLALLPSPLGEPQTQTLCRDLLQARTVSKVKGLFRALCSSCVQVPLLRVSEMRVGSGRSSLSQRGKDRN